LKTTHAPIGTPANTQNPNPGAPATITAPAAPGNIQRPLQIGQLVRLTPLPPGQSVAITAPSATATPTAGKQPLIVLPPSAGTPAATAIPAATIAAPSGNNDAIARLLLPLLQSAAPATGAPGLPSTAPLVTQLSLNLLAQHLKESLPLPGQTQPLQIQAALPQLRLNSATPLDLRVSALIPPAAGNATPSAPALAALFNGTPGAPALLAQVAGQTRQGLPVIELPSFTLSADGTPKAASAMMVLQFPARGLAPATIVKFDVLAQPQTAAPGMPAPAGEAITWDALEDVIHQLAAQPQGQAALQAVQAALPKPGGAAFTAPVLMFVAALRGGDVTGWMGEKGLEGIRASRRADALTRVLSDFAASGTRKADDAAAPPGEWRALTLPMLYGHELSRIQLHYRDFERDGDENQNAAKKTGTRFVMDLELTRMGPMQIDGFSIGNRLDVTLRSEQNMSAAMRESLRARYHDAVTGIGFTGDLNFNASAEHKGWVNIEDPLSVRQA
jgi:hypothetical protein